MINPVNFLENIITKYNDIQKILIMMRNMGQSIFFNRNMNKYYDYNRLIDLYIRDIEFEDYNISPYHLEGDVYTHTLMVMNHAMHIIESKNLNDKESVKLILASLFHDTGKTISFIEKDNKIMFPLHWVKSGNIFRDICIKTNYFDNIISKEDMLDIYKIIQLHHVDSNTCSKLIKDNFHMDITRDVFYILCNIRIADVKGRITKQTIPSDRMFDLYGNRPFKDRIEYNFNLESTISKINNEIKDDDVVIIIPMGAPGSGKSWCSNKIKNIITNAEYYVFGYDYYRLQIAGINKDIQTVNTEEYNEAFEKTKNIDLYGKLLKDINVIIKKDNNPKVIYIDNTNIYNKSRMKVIKPIRNLTKRLNRNLKIVGIFLADKSLNDLIEINNNRSYSVPQHVIVDMYMRLEYPMHCMFDDIVYIF